MTRGRGALLALAAFLVLTLSVVGSSYAWYQRSVTASLRASAGAYAVTVSVACDGETLTDGVGAETATSFDKTYTFSEVANRTVSVTLRREASSTLDCRYRVYLIADGASVHAFDEGATLSAEGVTLSYTGYVSSTLRVVVFTTYATGAYTAEEVATMAEFNGLGALGTQEDEPAVVSDAEPEDASGVVADGSSSAPEPETEPEPVVEPEMVVETEPEPEPVVETEPEQEVDPADETGDSDGS